jgi:hypothetical protein
MEATFKDRYENFPKGKSGTFRKKIMDACGWSESTFARKVRKNNLTKLELEKVNQIQLAMEGGEI